MVVNFRFFFMPNLKWVLAQRWSYFYLFLCFCENIKERLKNRAVRTLVSWEVWSSPTLAVFCLWLSFIFGHCKASLKWPTRQHLLTTIFSNRLCGVTEKHCGKTSFHSSPSTSSTRQTLFKIYSKIQLQLTIRELGNLCMLTGQDIHKSLFLI